MNRRKLVAMALFMAASASPLVIEGTALAQNRSGAETASTKPADIAAVRATLANYQQALNASDTDAVMKLYAADGVFMPPFSPSAVGAASVRKTYDAVFKAIKLSVTFDIVEIIQVAPGWAFARTNSAGRTLIHATGITVAEGNQELFVLRKDTDGQWKIARYSFSPISKPN